MFSGDRHLMTDSPAARQGCRRVVYASSVNAVLGYEGVGRDGEAAVAVGGEVIFIRPCYNLL